MNKEELNRLLDSVYELEGLVHLALSRDDCPEALPSLIARKGRELAALAGGISSSEFSEHSDESELSEHSENSEDSELSESVEISEIPELSENPEPLESPEPAEPREEGKAPRGRLVFSINDRYRFKRELFNNSDAEFNNTLAFVASMEDYEEAESYFLDELQLDPSNPDVAAFLDILKNYFK